MKKKLWPIQWRSWKLFWNDWDVLLLSYCSTHVFWKYRKIGSPPPPNSLNNSTYTCGTAAITNKNVKIKRQKLAWLTIEADRWCYSILYARKECDNGHYFVMRQQWNKNSCSTNLAPKKSKRDQSFDNSHIGWFLLNVVDPGGGCGGCDVATWCGGRTLPSDISLLSRFKRGKKKLLQSICDRLQRGLIAIVWYRITCLAMKLSKRLAYL